MTDTPHTPKDGAFHTPRPLPHMTIHPARPGIILFDGDPMTGMLAGMRAADIALACNAYADMLAALEALQEQLECPARNTNRGRAYREGVTISTDIREMVRAARAKARGDSE